MRDLLLIRRDIDRIDEGIKDLFEQRRRLVGEVALFKKEQNLPIYVEEREKLILSKCDDNQQKALLKILMRLGRNSQYEAKNEFSDNVTLFFSLSELSDIVLILSDNGAEIKDIVVEGNRIKMEIYGDVTRAVTQILMETECKVNVDN